MSVTFSSITSDTGFSLPLAPKKLNSSIDKNRYAITFRKKKRYEDHKWPGNNPQNFQHVFTDFFKQHMALSKTRTLCASRIQKHRVFSVFLLGSRAKIPRRRRVRLWRRTRILGFSAPLATLGAGSACAPMAQKASVLPLN